VVQAPEKKVEGPGVVTKPPAPSTGPSVVKAPEKPAPGPPVAAQPAHPSAPAQPPGMPEDIRRYLAFLESAEQDRRNYEARLSNIMLGLIPSLMMPNFDSDKVQGLDPQMVQMYNRIAQEYAIGTRRFQLQAQRIGVPASCRVLHLNYSYALSRNPTIIVETARRLVAGDYGGLHQMLATVGADMNQKYSAADFELGRICGQYNMPKPFQIGEGSSGGSIFGF
jgi:hypothetical protein